MLSCDGRELEKTLLKEVGDDLGEDVLGGERREVGEIGHVEGSSASVVVERVDAVEEQNSKFSRSLTGTQKESHSSMLTYRRCMSFCGCSPFSIAGRRCDGKAAFRPSS